MSGVLLFGLQLQCVHSQRIKRINEQKNKINKIIPFEEAGDTTHRKRLKSLDQIIFVNHQIVF